MNRWIIRLSLCLACLVAWPLRVPAPLIYRAGEGWTYEPVGGGKWTRTRAKDQVEVAQAAFDKKDYSLALKASRRTVQTWPLSDYASQAQYLLARSYEAKGQDERAFKEYQNLLEKYPKAANYEEVLQRQFVIANRFLGGQWFKLWGYIPFAPSMDKTSEMYEKIIKNGIYSEIAPQAQLNIGAAREKQESFFNRNDPFRDAVKAYEKAADIYHDREKVAADALYKAADAYAKQAKSGEYDQSLATKAIEAYSSFAALYPQDQRSAAVEQLVTEMRTEQAHGALKIARFYEKKQRWDGALVYYNEVLIRDPKSIYAQEAKERIEELKKKAAPETAKK